MFLADTFWLSDIRKRGKKPYLVGLNGIDCWSVNQRVDSSFPSQGTYLGCRSSPQLAECDRQTHIDVSLPLFLPPFFSLYK